MLKKRYRLKNKYAFKATYKLRNTVANKYLILYIGKIKPKDEISTKIGFVVSKKNHKSAVKRNRLKRLMRESCRLALKTNSIEHAQKHLSLIFLAKNNAVGQDFKTINEAVLQLFYQISTSKV